MRYFFMLLILWGMGACMSTPNENGRRQPNPVSDVMVAKLGRFQGDETGFAALRGEFRRNNPGYDLDFRQRVYAIDAEDASRIVFIQSGESRAWLKTRSGEEDAGDSVIGLGDVILLRPGISARFSGPTSAVVFTVKDELPPEIPAFIRPDHDPAITDTPGGCATDDEAYRRLLLTWKPENGPYVYHGLNAHRVRIIDSFSHYHPVDGGFDEFYLVQESRPNGRIVTSSQLDRIERPDGMTGDEARNICDVRFLNPGDLVYLRREVVHRGVGDVVVQVISIPGFKPGAEIGVDHHFRAINEKLALRTCDMIPFNADASTSTVVK